MVVMVGVVVMGRVYASRLEIRRDNVEGRKEERLGVVKEERKEKIKSEESRACQRGGRKGWSPLQDDCRGEGGKEREGEGGVVLPFTGRGRGKAG